jgi:hypothetical protein
MKEHGFLFIFKSSVQKSGTVSIQDKVIKPLPWHPAASGLHNTIILVSPATEKKGFTFYGHRYWQNHSRTTDSQLDVKMFYAHTVTSQKIKDLYVSSLYDGMNIQLHAFCTSRDTSKKCAVSWFSFCSPKEAVTRIEEKAQCSSWCLVPPKQFHPSGFLTKIFKALLISTKHIP